MRLTVSQIRSKWTVFARLIVAMFALQSSAALGQQPSQGTRPPEKVDDVISINTELVQTDVQVFDRSGRLIGNLERDQFELRVDGKAQKLEFFERILAGSPSEERQLAGARGKSSAAPTVPTFRTDYQKRVIAFFVDDLHLAPENIERTKKLLEDFVINRKDPGDLVMIASSIGQPGFLQQFTDSKKVLLEAISRLRYQPQSSLDTTNMPMTTYEALAIERNDWGVINRKVNEAMARYPLARRQRILEIRLSVEQEVRGTARYIARQAAVRDSNVLLTLESLARGSAAIRGRKLVFFISDGFVLDSGESDVRTKLLRLTDAAARNGVVIYTVDARGLYVGFADASTEVLSMETRSETSLAESVRSQEVLRVLAADTGGRAILNTNKPVDGIAKALRETSAYYLLAWRPERMEAVKSRLYRIEVSIKGRPELVVFARSGFLNSDPTATLGAGDNARKPGSTTPNSELASALRAPLPRRDLRVSLYPSFTNDALSGSVLTISTQLSKSDYSAVSKQDTQAADLTVGCLVLNAEGKSVFSTGRQLFLTSASDQGSDSNDKIVAEFFVAIERGLYQVRCAVADGHNERLGSAYEWIEIPQFVPPQFSLSTLLLSEQKVADGQKTEVTPDTQDFALNIDRRFSRTSRLLCQTYIYNARTTDGPPRITVQINLLSHKEVIAAGPPQLLTLTGLKDAQRIPYFVPIPLKELPAGDYTLQVIATDQVAKKSVSQEMDFTIQ